MGSDSPFGLVNLLFAEGIIFERLSCFVSIDIRREDIVEPKLSWKDVLHYTHSLVIC